jgi:hypothetical protein
MLEESHFIAHLPLCNEWGREIIKAYQEEIRMKNWEVKKLAGIGKMEKKTVR